MTVLRDLFADPNLARDAQWRAGGSASPLPLRIILRHADRLGRFSETRLLASIVIEVRTAEASALAEGDAFEIDDETIVVQDEPVRDSKRLVWTGNLRKTS